MHNCPICDGKMDVFDKTKLLRKYDISYYQCAGCGFICTEEPFWVDEAYSSAIANIDIDLIDRNIRYSKKIAALIRVFFRQKKHFLDYGAGYGMFVRLLRDKGYDFEWYDKYCDNVFAQYHEKSREKYDVVTALELFEHMISPKKEVGEILSMSDSVIFTTSIIPRSIKSIADWNYFLPDYGQHVSFYTHKALQILAAEHGKYYVGSQRLHIISDRRISFFAFAVVIVLTPLINFFFIRKSLAPSDYELAKHMQELLESVQGADKTIL